MDKKIDSHLLKLYVFQYQSMLKALIFMDMDLTDPKSITTFIAMIKQLQIKVRKLLFQGAARTLLFSLMLDAVPTVLSNNDKAAATKSFKEKTELLKKSFPAEYSKVLEHIIKMAYFMNPEFSVPYFLEGVQLGIIDFIPPNVIPQIPLNDDYISDDGDDNSGDDEGSCMPATPENSTPARLSLAERIVLLQTDETIDRSHTTVDEDGIFDKKVATFYKTLEKLNIRLQKEREFAERTKNPFSFMNSVTSDMNKTNPTVAAPIKITYTQNAKKQYRKLSDTLQKNVDDIEKDIREYGRSRTSSEVLGDCLVDGTPLISVRINGKHRFIYTRIGQKITVYQSYGHYKD